MERYTQFLLRHKKMMIGLFVTGALLCAVLSCLAEINCDFADYLPDNAASVKALKVMEDEYSLSIPNMRVLIYDVSIPGAMAVKAEIAAVDGVEEINWLDDVTDIYAPLETAEQKTIDDWYRDGNALFSITVDDAKGESVIPAVREIIGDENCMEGPAVTNVLGPINTSGEAQRIMLLAVPVVLLILILVTDCWFGPVLFILTIGAAFLLNRGTNLLFGSVSFVGSAAGSLLQPVITMGYSVFLMNRFSENREKGMQAEKAMAEAVRKSAGYIFPSGLTIAAAFLALSFMQFKIGPDMGWLMIRATGFSLLSVFCFLPALAAASCRLMDKTRHRSFVPGFEKFSAIVMKIRFPMLILFILLLPVSFLGQRNNDFLYGRNEAYSADGTRLGRDMKAINSEYGSSGLVVLMVPRGDMEKEIALNEELKKPDYVTSVVSYVNSAGNEIPDSFLPSETVSKLYSAHYSRFIIRLDAGEKDAGWYEKVNDIRNIGEKYYGDKIQYAGELVNTGDLKAIVNQDNNKVNFPAIAFVFLILLLIFKSLALPVILTLVIEASIWINLGIPYFQGQTLFYTAFLAAGTVQLGAAADYALLFSGRYMEFRKRLPKKEAAREALKACTPYILIQAAALTLAGLVLGRVCTNGVLSQLGILTGRGAALSCALIIFALPALLLLFDGFIEKTTLHCDFYREESKKKRTLRRMNRWEDG